MLRSMHNTSPLQQRLHEYLVLISDHPDKLAERPVAQPIHIKEATPLIEAGRLTYFGVTLESHGDASEDRTESTAAGSQPRINGSLMVVRAENQDSVLEMLTNDAYTKAGVWDLSSAKVIPFKGG